MHNNVEPLNKGHLVENGILKPWVVMHNVCCKIIDS